MGGFRALWDWCLTLLTLGASAHGATLGRYLLAVVFMIAGQFKLRHPHLAAQSMVAFGVTRHAKSRYGLLLGVAEVIIALLLVVDQTAVYGSLVAVGTTGVLLALIGRALYEGRRFPCGCFSSSEEDLNFGTAVRGATLLGVAVLTGVASSRGLISVAWSERPLYGVVAIALIALLALTTSAIGVWRANQRLERSIDWEWIVQEHPRLHRSNAVR